MKKSRRVCPTCGGCGSIPDGRPKPALLGDPPAVKAARTKQRKRFHSDEGLAVELAGLIRSGDTLEMARTWLGIGDKKAKRVRAVAVKMGLLKPNQRTRHA